MGVAALANMTALSKRNDSPETASRPFDGTRDGFVLGEGGGVVVVESLAHARERGATPIAEILGGALTADAFHISAPEPTGRGQARAMTNALRNSGVAPDEVDYIVAHGTATPLNDVTETRAIKAAYGDHAYKVAISSPKSMIGHLVGAAGIASALAGDRGDPRRGHPADRQPAHARPGVRPRLRAADGPQGEGRHRRGRRLRLRRPERGRDPPPRRRLGHGSVVAARSSLEDGRDRSSRRPPSAPPGWRRPSTVSSAASHVASQSGAGVPRLADPRDAGQRTADARRRTRRRARAPSRRGSVDRAARRREPASIATRSSGSGRSESSRQMPTRRLELGHRVGVVVHPQVDPAIGRPAVATAGSNDEEGGRLAAARIAAGPVAGQERGQQPVRQRAAGRPEGREASRPRPPGRSGCCPGSARPSATRPPAQCRQPAPV